jgi:uncharacterized membrane protein
MPHFFASFLCWFCLFGAALGGGQKPFIFVASTFCLLVFSATILWSRYSGRRYLWSCLFYFLIIGLGGSLFWVFDAEAREYFRIAGVLLTFAAFAGSYFGFRWNQKKYAQNA